MVGRKRKAPGFHGVESESNEVNIRKAKPLLKKDLEILITELKVKLEDESKRKTELEVEVNDLQVKLKEKTTEAQLLQDELNSIKLAKELNSEGTPSNLNTKGARKCFEMVRQNL